MSFKAQKSAAEKRDFLIYYRNVLMREARARWKRHRDFARTLVDWARAAHREAMAIDVTPAQGLLL